MTPKEVARLQAALQEAERQRDEAREAVGDYMKLSSEQADEAGKWRKRAEAAEAREVALREALIEIVNVEKGITGHGNPYAVARRALATADPGPN